MFRKGCLRVAFFISARPDRRCNLSRSERPRNPATDRGRAPKTMPTPSKQPKLDSLGLSAICERVAAGETLTEVAASVKASVQTFLVWVESDPERSARVREARMQSARMWDEKATAVIQRAANPFQLAKAKELAHHYRWRAAKINPRDYGEKREITVEDKRTEKDMSTDELTRIAAGGSAGAPEAPSGADKSRALH